MQYTVHALPLQPPPQPAAQRDALRRRPEAHVPGTSDIQVRFIPARMGRRSILRSDLEASLVKVFPKLLLRALVSKDAVQGTTR